SKAHLICARWRRCDLAPRRGAGGRGLVRCCCRIISARRPRLAPCVPLAIGARLAAASALASHLTSAVPTGLAVAVAQSARALTIPMPVTVTDAPFGAAHVTAPFAPSPLTAMTLAVHLTTALALTTAAVARRFRAGVPIPARAVAVAM